MQGLQVSIFLEPEGRVTASEMFPKSHSIQHVVRSLPPLINSALANLGKADPDQRTRHALQLQLLNETPKAPSSRTRFERTSCTTLRHVLKACTSDCELQFSLIYHNQSINFQDLFTPQAAPATPVNATRVSHATDTNAPSPTLALFASPIKPAQRSLKAPTPPHSSAVPLAAPTPTHSRKINNRTVKPAPQDAVHRTEEPHAAQQGNEVDANTSLPRPPVTRSQKTQSSGRGVQARRKDAMHPTSTGSPADKVCVFTSRARCV